MAEEQPGVETGEILDGEVGLFKFGKRRRGRVSERSRAASHTHV